MLKKLLLVDTTIQRGKLGFFPNVNLLLDIKDGAMFRFEVLSVVDGATVSQYYRLRYTLDICSSH